MNIDSLEDGDSTNALKLAEKEAKSKSLKKREDRLGLGITTFMLLWMSLPSEREKILFHLLKKYSRLDSTCFKYSLFFIQWIN